MTDKICTFCGAAGHRAHACPRRAHRSLFVGLLALAPALASAEILGVFNTAEGSVELHSEQGPCTAPALSATWVSNDQQTRIPGCWKPASQAVHVVFFDADVARIPFTQIKKPGVL